MEHETMEEVGYQFVWMAAFVILLVVSGSVLDRRLASRTLRLAFFPGFLLMGGLRLLFCEVSRVDKRRVGIFSSASDIEQLDGLPSHKRVLMVLGPFTVQFVAVALVLWLLKVAPQGRVLAASVKDSLGLNPLVGLFWSFGHTLVDVVCLTLQRVIDGLAGPDLLRLVAVYVVVSMVVAMTPPRQAGRHLLLGFCLLGLLVWLVSWIGVKIRPGAVFPARLDTFLATACGFAFWITLVVLVAVWLPAWLKRRRARAVTTRTTRRLVEEKEK